MQYIFIVFFMLSNIIISADENVNREGLHFGAGISVLGGRVTETTTDGLNNINEKEFFQLFLHLIYQ